MPKHGKKFVEAVNKIDKDKVYSPLEALELVKSISYAGFDETVEIHLRTGLDPRQADQQIRDVAVLPNGLGKTVRVLVFAQGEAVAGAKAGGADFIADSEEEINKIAQGFLDFDVAIATMDMMGKVGRLGRILGPRGLMPNPKAGTVVQPADMESAVKEAKAGRVEFRLDKSANIHVPIGKVSFTIDALHENMAALMSAIRRAKPSGAKGIFLRKVTLASTMGPGVKVETNSALAMEAKQL